MWEAEYTTRLKKSTIFALKSNDNEFSRILSFQKYLESKPWRKHFLVQILNWLKSKICSWYPPQRIPLGKRKMREARTNFSQDVKGPPLIGEIFTGMNALAKSFGFRFENYWCNIKNVLWDNFSIKVYFMKKHFQHVIMLSSWDVQWNNFSNYESTQFSQLW